MNQRIPIYRVVEVTAMLAPPAKTFHELCKMVGFDDPIRITYYRGYERFDEIKPKYEVVGTHTGRRSFICNALGMGISPQVVMKWTGHSD